MKITLILPIYNESGLIKETLNKLEDFVSKDKNNWEIILVNDGSTDNTLNILKQQKKSFFKIISYKENKGKGFAIKTGVKYATGEYICFTDSDLAYSFEHLNQIIFFLEKFPIVIGSREVKGSRNNATLLRKAMGKTFNLITRMTLNTKIKDMQCGLKGFKKEVAKELFSKQKTNDFSFDTEILYLAKKRDYIVKEIPVEISESHTTKKSKVNIFADPFKMLKALFKIRINDLKKQYE